jgi:hypothetical protein
VVRILGRLLTVLLVVVLIVGLISISGPDIDQPAR